MTRKINSDIIIDSVARACIEAACILDKQAYNAIESSLLNEDNETAKYVLSELLDNADIAEGDCIPLCQDTGMVISFVEMGIKVQLEEPVEDLINKGIKKGYEEGVLRKSVVKDPFERINTKDNTPAIVYIKQTEGDKLKINLMLKGFGSENMSFVKMLNPSLSQNEVVDIISDEICNRSYNACPPLFIGIGIAGTMDYACVLSKKALLRPLNESNINPVYSDMEERILDKLNKSNIGPAGYDGKTTALSVAILAYPTHIAGLPVAVTIQCHALRHREIIL
ncbi:MAG TPA: fumarate hydratase [Clostridia bacterium]|nr:fumarate hydratase [Clostridia bacterium]HOR88877.1 fumarate hydratase [Clostridia bacterium]HPL07203.1 fumarate hydratase [Clostridia bacterium]